VDSQSGEEREEKGKLELSTHYAPFNSVEGDRDRKPEEERTLRCYCF
jgi:hypothetical protein